MNPQDFKLRHELDEWRQNQLVKEGFDEDDFFGPQYLMADDILNRIVDLAHHSQLPTVQVLLEQTEWANSTKYGADVLKIVHKYTIPAPSPLTTQPLNRTVAPSVSTSAKGPLQMASGPHRPEVLRPEAQKKENKGGKKCRKCGATDHIGTSILTALSFV